jgi:hypothetical protein
MSKLCPHILPLQVAAPDGAAMAIEKIPLSNEWILGRNADEHWARWACDSFD